MNQSELARSAGVSHKSISVYLNRGVVPKRPTLEALADALRIPRGEFLEAAGESKSQGVFRLPEARAADAQTLTADQSELIYEMIRHLAEGNRKEVVGNVEHPTPIDDSTVVPIHGSGYRVHTEEDTDDPEALAADKGDHHRAD